MLYCVTGPRYVSLCVDVRQGPHPTWPRPWARPGRMVGGTRSDTVHVLGLGSRPLSVTPVAKARMQGGEVVRLPSESLSECHGPEAGQSESRHGSGAMPGRDGPDTVCTYHF